MAFYQAIGTGPVSFLDENENQQELPLSAIYFAPGGVDASSSPLYTTQNQPVIGALLQLMVAEGYLAPGTLSVTPASMTLTAAQAGPMGNSIAVKFATPSIAAGTVSVTVTATEVYEGLTPATILTTLGTTAATASGLVYVESGSGDMPGAVSSSPVGAAPGLDLAVKDAGDANTAFTLVATSTSDATDAELINITVTPDGTPTPSTFTLTVSWTKSTASPVSLASLLTSNPFSYVVSFGGSAGPLPSAGTVTLQGGAAASGSNPAVAASASILAGS